MTNPPAPRHHLHAPVAGSRRAYALLLVLTTAFILYGSLYPFEFHDRYYPGGPLAYLLTTWHDWDRRGDLLSNILLYMPFGFFFTYSMPPRMSGCLRATLAIVVGTVLSASMEAAQFNIADRFSSMGDAYANAIGSAAGASAAAALGASIRWPFVRELRAQPNAGILLAMFFGYRLYPYLPTINLHKYWRAVRVMLLAPSVPPLELAHYVMIWLVLAAIIHSLYGFRRFLFLLPVLAGVEFMGKVLIVGNVLTAADVGGAVGAYLLWALALRRLPGRYAIIALAFAVTVGMWRLQPFLFSAMPHHFDWIPFHSFVDSSEGPALQAFCEKFFMYGGLIWLLQRCGTSLSVATVTTAALLCVTSVAECWLPGRSAEITDAAMVLVLGGVFGLLRNAADEGTYVPPHLAG